jgi:hypothetical protein
LKQNKMLGQQQEHAQKRNKMETKADQLNDGDPQLLRPLKMYLLAPSTESSSTKQHLQEGRLSIYFRAMLAKARS